MWPRMAGRHVPFQPRLRLVLRILLQFVSDVLVDGLRALGGGDEIVSHDAGLQSALVAVERGAPGVVGIRLTDRSGGAARRWSGCRYSNMAVCASAMLDLPAFENAHARRKKRCAWASPGP